MKSQPQAEKKKRSPERCIRDLLKARHTLIWCETGEERRAERAVAGASAREGYDVRLWDCSTGATDLEGKKFPIGGSDIPETNPHAVFEKIRERKESAVWIMRDLHRWLDDVHVVRAVKSLARDLQDEMDPTKLTTIVILSPVADIPSDLRSSVTVVDWPLPTRADIGVILDHALKQSGFTMDGDRDAVIDAAAGLPADDVANAFALSLVRYKRVDPAEVLTAKKSIIDREKLLTWFEPDPRGMEGIGGLGLLKSWLMERRLAFTPEARAYGLPPVKGVLLVGPSGTGKTLTAKCAAAAFGVPLLRFDLGALKSKWVGESEGNIRRALRTAEAITKCILWLDELEKALAGTRSASDSASSDQLGYLLTWMQEQTNPIFMVATSNDPTAIPPELISRFDETFFVDLPTIGERVDILSKTLSLYGRRPGGFQLRDIAAVTDGYSGRELSKVVGSAMFRAFADGQREVRTDDILVAAKETKPVSVSAAETVSALKKWADGRARRASVPEVEMSSGVGGGFGRLLTVTAGDDEEEI